MIAQVKEMNKQTGALIEQKGEMGKQSEAMVRQGETLIKQTELVGKQLKNAEVAIRQTETAIDRTAMEARAWVSATQPQLYSAEGRIDDIPSGEQIWANTTVRNTGRTPAFVIGNVADLDIHEDETTIPGVISRAIASARQGGFHNPLAAGSGIDGKCPPRTFLNEEVKSLSPDGSRLILIGVVLYKDIYDNPRELHYVFFWDTADKVFKLHPRYQYMN